MSLSLNEAMAALQHEQGWRPGCYCQECECWRTIVAGVAELQAENERMRACMAARKIDWRAVRLEYAVTVPYQVIHEVKA